MPRVCVRAQWVAERFVTYGAACGAGTDIKHAREIYHVMKLPVVGGITQAEGVALGAFMSCEDSVRTIPDTNLGIHGVLLEDGASHCMNYVNLRVNMYDPHDVARPRGIGR